MASKKITMYSEKQHEFSYLKDQICSNLKNALDADLVGETVYELGETKVMMLLFENWYLRTGSFAGLSILITEYHGCQSADIISIAGKEHLFSLGAEADFAAHGEEILKKIGFSNKAIRQKNASFL